MHLGRVLRLSSFLLLLLGCIALPAFGVGEIPDIKDIDEKAPPSKNRKSKGSVGADLKDFGEGIANRLDSIVQRQVFDLWGDPWTLQGIPLILPTGDNGFHLGFRVALQNVKRHDPHLFEMQLQVLATDKGRYKHLIELDFPHAFNDLFHFNTRVSYDRDITIRYFGVGNETPIDFTLLDQDSVLFRNIREGPSITFRALRNFGNGYRAGPIAGFKWLNISVPPGSLLERDQPAGIAGGATHYLGLAFIYDGLDFEPYPSKGVWHELFVAFYQPFFGSDYSFNRYTYTYRRFARLHRKLIFAHRTLFEVLDGNAPYYELGMVGGSKTSLTFGGDRFLRGFEGNRFMDKIRLAFGFELRWDPLQFEFADQQLKLGFVPFFDIGRVWPDILPIRLGTWHASTGWGIRTIWNNRFVVRADFAVAGERTAFFVELGNAF